MINRFTREMENISIHVASGKIDKTLLQEIIESLIYESEYSEELQLKIITSTME